MTPRVLTFLFFVLLTEIVSGQDSRKTIILYNVVPLSVELVSDGTIKAVYGRADHYFKGYQLIQREEDVQNDKDYADMPSNSLVSEDVYRINYQKDVATLNEQAIKDLEAIKVLLFTQQDKKIIITPYEIDEQNKKEVILSQNRLSACLSYLEILGVNKEQIILDNTSQINNEESIIISSISNEQLHTQKAIETSH